MTPLENGRDWAAAIDCQFSTLERFFAVARQEFKVSKNREYQSDQRGE
jgi:hypothetical protein